MSIFGGIFENKDETKKETTDNDANLRLRKEELDIAKSRVQKGEVEFGKEIIEEQINQPVIVEEAHIQAHPLEAPQQAPSEEIIEADTATDQTPQTDESEEDTTE